MTEDEWRSENRDEDSECTCYDCGDPVDTDEDIHCGDNDVWYHTDCCVFSEWLDRYVSEGNAVHSDLLDSYLESNDSRCLCSASQYESDYLPNDHEDLRVLWLPETYQEYVDTASLSMATVLRASQRGSSQIDDNGCIVFVHAEDCQEFHTGQDDYTHVPLSWTIYGPLTRETENSELRHLAGHDAWARFEDCVCIHFTEDPEDSYHFVLTLHITTNPLALAVLSKMDRAFTIYDPKQKPNEIIETEETQ